MTRFGPSTLVEAGEQKFLFDAGRGALQRLTELNVPWQAIQGVFLTHLHSDHVVGFPDLWLTGWLIAPAALCRFRSGVRPAPRTLMSHLRQAYKYDIAVRIENDRVAPDGVLLRVNDIREGVVYQRDGIRVTAFDVDHAPIA
jgi:ribonuclease Z